MVLADPPVRPARLHRDDDGRIMVPDGFELPSSDDGTHSALQAQWLFDVIQNGLFPLRGASDG